MILAEVAKNGANRATWTTLAESLKRFRPETIELHFRVLENSMYHSGKWTLNEDEIVLEHLFEEKKDSCLDLIDKISVEHLKPLVSVLSRSLKHIYSHWHSLLRPILLSYHNGELHFDWSISFFKFLIEKQIITTRDIFWPEVLRHFPCQTYHSLASRLHKAIQSHLQKEDKPIHVLLSEILPVWRHRRTMSSVAKYREDIVHLYDKVRGI